MNLNSGILMLLLTGSILTKCMEKSSDIEISIKSVTIGYHISFDYFKRLKQIRQPYDIGIVINVINKSDSIFLKNSIFDTLTMSIPILGKEKKYHLAPLIQKEINPKDTVTLLYPFPYDKIHELESLFNSRDFCSNCSKYNSVVFSFDKTNLKYQKDLSCLSFFTDTLVVCDGNR